MDEKNLPKKRNFLQLDFLNHGGENFQGGCREREIKKVKRQRERKRQGDREREYAV